MYRDYDNGGILCALARERPSRCSAQEFALRTILTLLLLAFRGGMIASRTRKGIRPVVLHDAKPYALGFVVPKFL